MAGNYFNILLFGISGGEIMLIFLLVLLLFGPKKIPELARMFGRGINEFKKVQREINSEIHRYSSEVEAKARDMQSEIDHVVGKGPAKSIAASAPVAGNTAEKKPDLLPEDLPAPSLEKDDLPYPYNQKTEDSL